MKTIVLAAALSLLAFSPAAFANAKPASPPICTLLYHPVGCVEPEAIFVHSSTGFTKTPPNIPPADAAAVKAILHISP